MAKSIKIACKGAAEYDYKKLIPLQGDLKELTDESYEKFKANILELGFSEPISIWKHKRKIHILNGHQRLETIKRMVENEGYSVKPLPVSIVEAADLNEAKRKILSLTSQFGKVDEKGLAEFIDEAQIPAEDLRKYDLQNVNLDKFIEAQTKPVDIEENPEPEIKDEGEPQKLSQVKTVKLYFDTKTANEFQDKLDIIQERHDTESITETILLAVKMAYDKRYDEVENG